MHAGQNQHFHISTHIPVLTLTMSYSKLFQPIRVGDLTLKHRVVLAPLTRSRATGFHAPGPLAAEYYSQRASTPGTLLVTEATLVATKAGSYSNVPGIYTNAQIDGWKKVSFTVFYSISRSEINHRTRYFVR